MSCAKRSLNYLLCIILCLNILGGNSVIAVNAQESYVSFVEDFIASNSDGLLEEEQWGVDTIISNTIILYDLDENITGYVCTLTQNGECAGYVQLSVTTTGYEVVAYSYSGISCVESIYQDQVFDVNIYELGVMDYAIEDDSGNTNELLLSSGEVISRQEALARIELFENSISNNENEEEESIDSTISSSAIMLSGYSKFTLVKTSDFSGYSNHCSPTAATNIFKYYYYAKGYGNYASDSATFKKLYSLMKTNSTVSGTLYDDIFSGMCTYAYSNSVTIKKLERKTSPTLSYITGLISSGYPVQLELKNFTSSGEGHSVAVFGYSVPFIILSTGWDNEYHYYQYSLLTVAQSECVGY